VKILNERKSIMADDKTKKENVKEKPQEEEHILHEKEGLIQDEEINIALKKIHSGLEGDLDDNEEENTMQKGFDRSSR